MNFLRQGFRKLSSERQTNMTKIIYHTTFRMVKNSNTNKIKYVKY